MYNKYNKQKTFYIADAQGKLIKQGIIISMDSSKNGELIITIKEKHKYNPYKNKPTRQVTA